jgi:hypothetical protein
MNLGEPRVLHSTDPVIALPIGDLGMEKRPKDLEMASVHKGILNYMRPSCTHSLSVIDGITGTHHSSMVVFL